MKRIVIVGAGLAGHRAAHTLRKDGYTGELVVIGDEPHRPYDRPPLSKQLLAGSIEPDRVFLPGPEIECDWMLGAPATGLDTEAGNVRVGEREVPYDGLIIATGRRARRWPELPALDGFQTLRGLDDNRALKAAVTPGANVVIVGAGFIGCEVAATLRGLGVASVTLLDLTPYPMAVLGADAGEHAAEVHRTHGVELRMGASVSGFEGEGRVRRVVLADGEQLAADVVLLALGAVPNGEWLEGSGLELQHGCVVCDEHCLATGVERVAVAGDIAAFPHRHSDRPVSIEHWSNAREMGALAAANLIAPDGERKAHASVPNFWSDQYDVKIKSAGLLAAADRHTVVDRDGEKGMLLIEAHHGDTLVGAIGFNCVRRIVDYQRELAG